MRLPIPQAMAWKYGAKCSKTSEGDDIAVWEHPTLPQPSKAQIAIDVEEYKAYLTAQKILEIQAKQDIEGELAKPAGNPFKILKAMRVLGRL